MLTLTARGFVAAGVMNEDVATVWVVAVEPLDWAVEPLDWALVATEPLVWALVATEPL